MATAVTNKETCDKSFCEDYQILRPKNVGLWDLIMLLFSKHIGNRKFVDCPDGTVESSFSRRLVIFISIVAQKTLQLVSKPLAWLGSAIEFVANLLDANGGLVKLVWNLIRGKKVKIDRMSPDFLSVIGLTDTRLELDDEITHQDPRYNSALTIMAAKTAYENPARVKKIVQDHWKMEFIGFYNCWNGKKRPPSICYSFMFYFLIPRCVFAEYEKKRSTQVFMFSDKSGDYELICVSFRGTSLFSADDWRMDLDLSWYHLSGIGKLHAGFLKALGLQKTAQGCASWPKELEEDKDGQEIFAYYKIRQVLREKLDENKDAKFIVAGHSLGGALAALFPTILAFHNEVELLERLEGVYTFGQPRVGDDEFCKFMERVLGVTRYFRFVYGNDVVPRIPFDDSNLLFKHFGYCYYFNSLYKGQVMKEEPNKNYFSIKWIAPKYLNAVLEMIRSFIMPYAYGMKYKEGLLLLGVRSFGLLVPGASAHGPQDYVNLTRLGSPHTFNTLQLYDCDRLVHASGREIR